MWLMSIGVAAHSSIDLTVCSPGIFILDYTQQKQWCPYSLTHAKMSTLSRHFIWEKDYFLNIS